MFGWWEATRSPTSTSNQTRGKTVFAAIAIVLFAITAVICATIAVKVGSGQDSPRAGFIFIAAFTGALSIIITITTCVTVVGAAETGVPVTFGRIGSPMSSGIHTKAPWTKVHGFPKRPLPVDDMDVKVRSSQAGQFGVTVAARWHIDPAHATDTYLQVRTGSTGKISKDIVGKALGQAVSEVYAQMENVQAVNDRAGAQDRIRTALASATQRYGVQIDDVFLRQVEPDRVTADAIARYASQQQETKIARESQKTATEEARRRKIEAEGLRSAAAGIPSGVSDGQVTLLCAQAWERMATRAIAAGVSLYTSPCAAGAVVPAAK